MEVSERDSMRTSERGKSPGSSARAANLEFNSNSTWKPADSKVSVGSGSRFQRLLMLALLLGALLAFSHLPVEAKTHHSKRQAPNYAASAPSSRETTNWWNLWWQRKYHPCTCLHPGSPSGAQPLTSHSIEYINEAIQPTVRPIVGVSFNGRSIHLDEASADSGELEGNFVASTGPELAGNSSEIALNLSGANLDLERTDKLRLVADSSGVAESMSPFAARQVQTQSNPRKPSSTLDGNWQSVRPTIIQMPRDSRRRQADTYQMVDEMPLEQAVQPEDLGIQMRASMSRSRPPVVPAKLTPSDEGSRFEQQQQNQMADYGEDSEIDMENMVGAMGPTDQEPRLMRPATDSSSSSMMSSSEPPRDKPDDTVRQQPPPLMMSNSGRVEPTPPTTSAPTQPTESPSPARVSPASSSVNTPRTSTVQTSTRLPIGAVTEIELNETPISFETSAPRTTTPGGRVELKNGRPAPGMRQVMPSTNAVRLPSSSTSATFVEPTTPSSTANKRPEESTSSTTTTTRAPTTTISTTVVTDRTIMTSTSMTPSSATSAVNGTTTLGTTPDSNETTDDEDQDNEEPTDKPTLNSAGESSTSTDDDDEEEEDTDKTTTTQQSVTDSTTTTTTTMTTTSTTTSRPPSSAGGMPISTSANIEIERLPSSTMSGQQPSSPQPTQTTKANLVLEGSTDQQQTGIMSGNINDPITMPMEALVKMMMMNQMLDDERRKPGPQTEKPNLQVDTSSTAAPGERITMRQDSVTGGQTEMRPRASPPPTTKMPTPPPTLSTSTSSPNQPTRFMTIKIDSPTSELPSGEEPKLEMLNLDLMPIQRIMTAQDRMRKLQEQQQMSRGSSTESPAQPQETLLLSTASAIPVEPGMRLRPVTPATPVASDKTQMSVIPMMGIKMIGKNPIGAHTKKPVGDTKSGTKMAPAGSVTPQSTLNMTGQAQPSRPVTSSGGAEINISRNDGRPPATSVEATKSTLMDLATPSTSASTPLAREEEFSMSSSTKVTPGGRLPTSVVSESSVSSSTGSSPNSAGTTSISIVKLGSGESSSTKSGVESNEFSSTPTLRPMTSARLENSPRGTTPASSVFYGSSASPGLNSTAETRTESSPQQSMGSQPDLQAGSVGGATKNAPTSKQRTANSTLSNSFIPNKLRANYGKFNPSKESSAFEAGRVKSSSNVTSPFGNRGAKLTAEPTSTQTSVQAGMAIRQFGGANRMSVLANQPVPFGRPAAGRAQRFEVPVFEYGPAIAVRRPDEPLANGQMPNCTLTGKNFCVLTKDYPMNEVRQAVERSFRSVRIMYEELQTVSDQELHKEDFLNATSSQAAFGKFACQTQVEMMRPGWAKDEITKEWMLVVNTDVFPQRVRTESCAQPNTPCEFIAPFYDSTCQQRYSLHRMIAIDPHDPSRSPQVAVFKFPAGCVCRVHPIRKTTTSVAQQTTPIPVTVINSSTSRSIRRRRR